MTRTHTADISVIICTYNRSSELLRTLESLRAMSTEGVRWELLLVDNNSTDQTKAVCEAAAKHLPIRYIFEPKQGKSAALNRAISEASAPLLLFTDDDVTVTPDWMFSLYDAAIHHPEASYFGGRILPQWDCKPPKWFVENREWLWGQPYLDLGQSERAENHFLGANFAARKHIFKEGLFYRNDLGPTGVYGSKHSQPGMEDWELQERFIQRGLHGWYVPGALVYHRDAVHRMTEKYVRYWYKQKGRKLEISEEITSQQNWFGAPRYLWRQMFESAIGYCATRFTKPSKVWLEHEIRMAEKWGIICEFRERSKAPKSDPPRTNGRKTAAVP